MLLFTPQKQNLLLHIANKLLKKKKRSPTASNFQTPIIHSQLRVLKKSFEIDMITLFSEFKYAKNKDKRKTYQTTFDQKEKDRVKRK